MNEDEWLHGCDPSPMLEFLQEHPVSERRMRLLACACCRLIWDYLPDERSRNAVEVAERFADGEADLRELARARNMALKVSGVAAWSAYWAANVKAASPLWNAFAAAAAAPARRAAQQTQQVATWEQVQADSVRDQADLIRDVIGNPFRPQRIDFSLLGVQRETVVHLAENIYHEKAFEELPILADALEDGGVCDEAILHHCRDELLHFRGCWVVDLVLGKV